MLDNFGREINYLRISVTDRCNLRCFYCMPKDGIQLAAHDDILSFEEIINIVKIAVELGVNKVRLTGGEPLLRKGVVDLVKMLSEIKGINDLAMTTNGILLAEYASPLVSAGLKRVNVSLDTVKPRRFGEITGGGDIVQVLAGINAALEAGLLPLKINCTIKSSPDEEDAQAVKEYAAKKGIEVQFIPLMDFASGTFQAIGEKKGGDCKTCSRLRLLSNGKVLPCLFSDRVFDTKTLGVKEALKQAILHKPEKGLPCTHRWMCSVGG